MKVDNPTFYVSVSSSSGDSFCGNKDAKSFIRNRVNEVFNQATANNKSRKAIYSANTSSLTEEMIKFCDKAEKNLNDNKKKPEEALNEYFATVTVLMLDNPYVYVDGNTYDVKNLIKNKINDVFKKTVDKNNTQKAIYNKNIPVESK